MRFWSAGSAFAGMTTLLPSGRLIVPPMDAMIVWLTEANFPATTMGTEALFVGSAALVAVTDTVNGVGKLAGAK